MDNLEKDKAAFTWLTLAWDDYAANLPFLLPLLVVQAALSAGTFYCVWRFHSLLHALPYMLFVLTPVSTGMNLVYIKLARGSGARFLDLLGAFPVYHRALAVSLGLGLVTLGGALMLILPGIVLYLAFCFSEYAVVDRRTGVRESFALSAAVTEGWKSRLFAVFILIVSVNVLVPDIYVISGPLKSPAASLDLKPWTVAAAALKTFVFLPWLGLAMARAYNFLLSPPAPAPEESPVD
ncbi:MAG: hypothetical protein HY550_01910 [Elusimicrobia bacterium]|nr:hypothetical protein [Elusimicrobiota bacterium]